MREMAVGVALFWVLALVFARGQRVKIHGLGSVLFCAFIAWGLGNIFFAIIGKT